MFMENKIVGTITEEEKNHIERLYERKRGLSELLYSITDNNLLNSELKNTIYQKLVHDMGKTQNLYDKWWNDIQEKYRWESVEGGSYRIDFLSNNVLLICNNTCS